MSTDGTTTTTEVKDWAIFKDHARQQYYLHAPIEVIAHGLFNMSGNNAPMFFLLVIYDLNRVNATARATELLSAGLQLFRPGVFAQHAAHGCIPFLQKELGQTDEDIAPFKKLLADNGCDPDSPPEVVGNWTFYPQPDQQDILLERTPEEIMAWLINVAKATDDAFLLFATAFDLLQNAKEKAQPLLAEGRKYYDEPTLQAGVQMMLFMACDLAESPEPVQAMVELLKEEQLLPADFEVIVVDADEGQAE